MRSEMVETRGGGGKARVHRGMEEFLALASARNNAHEAVLRRRQVPVSRVRRPLRITFTDKVPALPGFRSHRTILPQRPRATRGRVTVRGAT